MTTRTEAMQALYDAADDLYVEVGNNPLARVNHGVHEALGRALDAYSTSTPDPLPAEVQGVLEAAEKWLDYVVERDVREALREPANELAAAVDAYRSTQPEPLSARLARLRRGSVVTDVDGDPITVIAVDDLTQRLFGAWEGKTSKRRCTGLFEFRHITAILSESP